MCILLHVYITTRRVYYYTMCILQQIAAEVSAPLARVDEIVMVGDDRTTSEVSKLVSQLPPAVQALTGVDLSQVNTSTFYLHASGCVLMNSDFVINAFPNITKFFFNFRALVFISICIVYCLYLLDLMLEILSNPLKNSVLSPLWNTLQCYNLILFVGVAPSSWRQVTK